jgi:hypothetical protein
MAKKDQTIVEDVVEEVEVHPNQADHLSTIDPDSGKPVTYGELRNGSAPEQQDDAGAVAE